MIVDVHAHVIVAELRPHVTPPPAAVGEFVDPAGILAQAEHAGIDHVVLSPWVQLLSGDPDTETTAEEVFATAPPSSSRAVAAAFVLSNALWDRGLLVE